MLFNNDPRVITFSMHCVQNYFSEKQHSDIDVELQAGTEDMEYLAKLQSWYVLSCYDGTYPALTSSLAFDYIYLPWHKCVLMCVHIFRLPYLTDTLKPDLIFFQAGVDPHKGVPFYWFLKMKRFVDSNFCYLPYTLLDDRLGKLKLTRAGLSKRNKMVFNAARRANARIVVTMGGG